MYPEYGSLKSGHQAHFYGRMCAKSSCIWQCRGRHLVLAAASPNAMPGLNFSGFGCDGANGPVSRALLHRARPKMWLQAPGTTFAPGPSWHSQAQTGLLLKVCSML